MQVVYCLVVTAFLMSFKRSARKQQLPARNEEPLQQKDEQEPRNVQLQEILPREASLGRVSVKKKHKRNTSITMPLPSKSKKKRLAQQRETRAHSKVVHDLAYEVRPMKFEDLSTVFHLGNEIFTASEFPNMYRTWDDFAVVENFEGSSEFCFVAQAVDNGNTDSTIIGFLLGETITKTKVGTRGYIQWVAILPQYRRLGIATKLLQSFLEQAKQQNVSLLLADTPADNEPAREMFRKVGLSYTADHVYLTKQLHKEDIVKSVVDEDLSFRVSYSAKGNRITIRPLEIDDLYQVYTIGEQIFTVSNANLYNFWDESYVLSSYMSDPELCLVATVEEETEEKVVGFCLGTTIEKPRSSWKYGYLVWLGCSPNYQGLGLASQMYNVMVELFHHERVRMLMIDTQRNNEGALKFFRKNGFGHDEDHVYLSNSPMSPP